MKKNKFLTTYIIGMMILGTASVLQVQPLFAANTAPATVTPPPPPPPPGAKDVAVLLYNVNKNLLRQEGKITATHEALLAAHEDYVKNPSEAIAYTALLRAAATDLAAVKEYDTLVSQAKGMEKEIQVAQTQFYEETPAPKAVITTGPGGKGTPVGGESVASEMNENQAQIATHLIEEIEENSGPNSLFATQLQEQATKLKSAKDRIAKEVSTPAVTTNPSAKAEDTSLQDALSRAIDARMEAVFCATHDEEECCEKYPNRCTTQKKK
ncbi:MAG: hypothetical protein K2P93_09670 [Alphaproteobacteria bacterium]|nr:hypothetical protein [Alphaproteobacteria bacterium]